MAINLTGLAEIGAGAEQGLTSGLTRLAAMRQQQAQLAAQLAYHQASLQKGYDLAGMRIDEQQRLSAARGADNISKMLMDPNRQADFNAQPGLRDEMMRDLEIRRGVASGAIDWHTAPRSKFVDPLTGEALLPAQGQRPAPGTDTGFRPTPSGHEPAAPWTPEVGQPESENPYLSAAGRARAQRVETAQAAQQSTADFHRGLLQHFGVQDILNANRFNSDLIQRQFTDTITLAKQELDAGHLSFQEQQQVWAKLLSLSVAGIRAGGNPGNFLKPLLFAHGMMGQQTPNEPAIREYLTRNGANPQEIDTLIKGLGGTSGGATFTGTPGQPNAPGATGAAMVPGGTPGGPPVLPPVNAPPGNTLAGAENFATGEGYRVSSTTGGEHNPGSLHYLGRAIDVSVRGKTNQEVQEFIKNAQAQGYVVRDERSRPPGQAVWGGPHLHLEWGPNTKPEAPANLGFTEPPPGGNPNQILPMPAPGAATGVRTPATAAPVKSPYPAGSPEDRIFGLYTGSGGRRAVPPKMILDSFRRDPEMQRRAAAVIDAANSQQREGLFSGAPVQSTNGAAFPTAAPDFSQLQIHMPGVGTLPGVPTTPVVLQGGFQGTFPGAPPLTPPAAPPVAPPMVAGAPYPGAGIPEQPSGGGGPIAGPIGSTSGGGGPIAGPITSDSGGGGAVPQPRGREPRLGRLGPMSSDSGGGGSITGPVTARGGRGAPTLRGLPPPPGETGVPVLDVQRSAAGGGLFRVPEAQAPEGVRNFHPTADPRAAAAAADELRHYQRLPYAAGMEKFFKVNGITDPVEQRNFYQWASAEVVPRMIQQAKMTPAQIPGRIFDTMQRYGTPARVPEARAPRAVANFGR